MKNNIKRYRAIGIVAIGLIFNLITSIMFAQDGQPFNSNPMSIGEWICDIISHLIVIFGYMTIFYDLFTFKPRKEKIYKRIDGEIVEITVIE